MSYLGGGRAVPGSKTDALATEGRANSTSQRLQAQPQAYFTHWVYALLRGFLVVALLPERHRSLLLVGRSMAGAQAGSRALAAICRSLGLLSKFVDHRVYHCIFIVMWNGEEHFESPSVYKELDGTPTLLMCRKSAARRLSKAGDFYRPTREGSFGGVLQPRQRTTHEPQQKVSGMSVTSDLASRVGQIKPSKVSKLRIDWC